MPTKIGGATTGSSGGSAVGSLTFAVAVGAGVGRCLEVGITYSPSPQIANSRTVTWNGQPLTRVGLFEFSANGVGVEIWYLPEASLSTTSASLIVTAVGTNQVLKVGAQTWGPVKQATPFGAFVGASGVAAPLTLPSVAATPGDEVIDILGVYNDASITLTPTYTADWKDDGPTFNINAGQSSRTATNLSMGIGWTSTDYSGGWWYAAAALTADDILMGQIWL